MTSTQAVQLLGTFLKRLRPRQAGHRLNGRFVEEGYLNKGLATVFEALANRRTYDRR